MSWQKACDSESWVRTDSSKRQSFWELRAPQMLRDCCGRKPKLVFCMGRQSLHPARDIFNCKAGSHPAVPNRAFTRLVLHMQTRNAIAGAQTESGSPAADLWATLSDNESLSGQREPRRTSVSLHQRWICFWVPEGYLGCLYSDNLRYQKCSEMINLHYWEMLRILYSIHSLNSRKTWFH